METSDRRESASQPPNPDPRVIDMTDLADRVRWRRYLLATAAANPYLERPAYAA